MKIVIVGCGKIGSEIVKSLTEEDHIVTAIDNDQSVIDDLSNIYDVMGVCGNGTDCDVLTEAGVKDAEMFIAATSTDELNMLSCYLAKKMGAKHTIARIRNPEYTLKSLGFLRQQLGLSLVINPEMLAALEMFNVLKLPSAVKIETFSVRNFEIDGNFVLNAGDKIGLTAELSEIQKLMRALGLDKKQAKSIMILGGGRISFYLSKMLISSGNSVKIIERSNDKCSELSDALDKAMIIHGDGAQQELLLEEGIESTDAFVSLTGMDEENILISIFASAQGVPTVITKVNRNELADMASKLGLDCVISPKEIVSDVLVQYARALENSRGSNVETLYNIMDGMAEVLEFNVRADFGYKGIKLRDLKLKPNILVAGIIRDRKPIIPTGDDVINANDKVIIVAADQRLNDLSDIIK